MRNYFRIQILPHLLRGTISTISPHPADLRDPILRVLHYFRIYCGNISAYTVWSYFHNFFAAQFSAFHIISAFNAELFPHLLQNYFRNFSHPVDLYHSILRVPHLLRNYFHKLCIANVDIRGPHTSLFLRIICRYKSAEKLRISALLFSEI